MISKFAQFLGSIRLAVSLLIIIAIVLVGTTFYESAVGSATVQTQIYKSAWFGALMFLLAVNLGISTLSRFPWRGPRKIGFALTHWGLVIIIAGSAAVIHLSTEGMLLVRTDSGPNDQIRVEGDLLEVVAPDQALQQTDVFIKPSGSVYPQQFAGLTLQRYRNNAIKTVRFVNHGAVNNLAVKVRLHSDRMGQSLERWLAVAPLDYSHMDIGPAHLEIVQAADEVELKQLLSKPDVSQGIYGQLSVADRVIDVQQALGQMLKLDNGLTVVVANVWPDFRLDARGQPTSASQQFRNPAVQLDLSQGDARGRWFVFSQPRFDPVRSGDEFELAVSYEAPETIASDYFRIVASPDHRLFYAAASSQGFKSGEFEQNQTVVPGWADFQISLLEQLDRATIQRQIVSVTPVASDAIAPGGSPALQVATADGEALWLPWGEPTSWETANGNYFAAFSPKMLRLPFYVKLDDFIVERNEGSESVAMWTSRVTLFDPETDRATQRTVWMNHPTWFRGWKLAQASWNPGDLKQSTLQLKREPWWVTALTWSGSLMVVLGIGTMFYGPGVLKNVRRFSRGLSSDAQSLGAEDADTAAHREAGVKSTIPILAVFGK